MRLFMRAFLSIFFNAIALFIVAQLFTSFYIDSFGTALLASIILSIINLFVKPILIVLTLPFTILTFGLFLFVINAITLMITQALFDSSFVIDSFGIAIIASIIISLIYMTLQKATDNR